MLKGFKNPSRQLLKSEQKRLLELVKLEREALSQGFSSIAGIDEAGRGPLAGPVVAAACIFKKQLFFPGINDSKLLLAKKREQLFLEISENEHVLYGVGIVSHTIIDEINILQATHRAMHEAVANLAEKPDFLLVDGLQLKGKIPSLKVIHGDRLSQIIAAASIIAKTVRDRLMLAYHEEYPEYGFDTHKGYGTQKHRTAVEKFGLCPIHRRSFSFSFNQMTQTP